MTIDVIRDQLKQLRMPAASAEIEGLVQKGKRSQDLKWLSELLSAEPTTPPRKGLRKRSSQSEEALSSSIGISIKNSRAKKSRI